jgi:hypothetical protein
MTTTITAGGETPPEIATLRTHTAAFGIDGTGSLSKLTIGHHDSLVAPGQPAPLLSVAVDGKRYAPDTADWDAHSKRLTLHYQSAGVTAVLSAEAKSSHVVFKVVDVQPPGRVEMVVWGPYPTSIRDIVGETIGVVRDSQVAMGLQALNPKTIGGNPDRVNDDNDGFGGDDHGTYPDLDPALLKSQEWRGEAARPTEFGSIVQAYCRDRSHERVIENWGHPKFVVPAYQDGGVIGSSIALFACPASKALATIGEIEIAEGLPHPLIDGVWGKIARGATASYLIADFSEENVDQAIEMTRHAGLRYLYHSSPFETWGHFKLKPDMFPHGWDGLKTCVDKARQSGIHLGFHTLSNFLTTNDPYVTPVPDPRLAHVGSSTLTADIDATQTEIPVAAPDLFSTNSSLNTVMVDQELIRFKSVSAQAPWRLLGCERGAWGTHAAAHQNGAVIGKLLDHPYNVFMGDASLSQETARHIADLFNHTGTLQTSFDGLEGNWSTGLGQYGRTLFPKAWFDALSPELRGHVINDASNPGHYNWHINTRMNWGEPWYAGFRESQTLYRFKNQVYFERNFMPHMLGWFALQPDTSIEDVEWLLARAAGFDAGFALATSIASTAQLAADPSSAETAKQYGAISALLEAIKQWETARMAGVFPADVRAHLRDSAREFHLQPVGKEGWDLSEAHLDRFSAKASAGEMSETAFHAVDAPQALQWTVHSTAKEPVTGLTVTLDGTPILDIKGQSIPTGGSVKYTGGPEAVIYDNAWRELGRVPVDIPHARVGAGEHRMRVAWTSRAEGEIKVEVRTYGPAVRIHRPARTSF